MEHTMNRHREEQRQNHIEMHNPTKATDANNHPFGDMKYVRTGATRRDTGVKGLGQATMN